MKLKAFMSDTFRPSKGAVAINTKGVIEGYRERYDQLISKAGPFHFDLYTIAPGGRKIIHVKIPSESVSNFNYDILLELDIPKGCADFGECDIKVFSNCPSFVYSLAYVFVHWDPDAKDPKQAKGMMIDMFKAKLPRDRMLVPGSEKQLGRKPVHDAPVTRNPMGIPLFDKSIYYAIFYIMDNLTPAQVAGNHNFRTAAQVFNNVARFDALMVQRKRMENQQKEKQTKAAKKSQEVFETHERKLNAVNRSGLKAPMKPKRATQVVSKNAMKSTTRPKTTKR